MCSHGSVQLRGMSNALSPTLRSIRQQEYYSDPRFHASIAWALLHHTGQRPPTFESSNNSLTSAVSFNDLVSEPDTSGSAGFKEFPTIAGFPPDMVSTLNANYGAKISSPTVGSFVVESTTLKIGKETFTWKFPES
jgi:hypothetical protein